MYKKVSVYIYRQYFIKYIFLYILFNFLPYKRTRLMSYRFTFKNINPIQHQNFSDVSIFQLKKIKPFIKVAKYVNNFSEISLG